MPDQEDVRCIALALPEVTTDANGFGFRVDGKLFAWVWLERTDPKRPRVPRPDVLAVRVKNQLEKASLLALDRDVFFTEPHYDGYPAVLVRLPTIGPDLLADLLTDAWRTRAPRRLAADLDR